MKATRLIITSAEVYKYSFWSTLPCYVLHTARHLMVQKIFKSYCSYSTWKWPGLTAYFDRPSAIMKFGICLLLLVSLVKCRISYFIEMQSTKLLWQCHSSSFHIQCDTVQILYFVSWLYIWNSSCHFLMIFFCSRWVCNGIVAYNVWSFGHFVALLEDSNTCGLHKHLYCVFPLN